MSKSEKETREVPVLIRWVRKFGRAGKFDAFDGIPEGEPFLIPYVNRDAYQALEKKIDEIEKELLDKFNHNDRIDSVAYALSSTREAKIKDLESKLQIATDSLLGFVEYFKELKKGNYSKTRPEIRTFELVLLDRAIDALKKIRGEK